jgi:histidinol dehydrogenase
VDRGEKERGNFSGGETPPYFHSLSLSWERERVGVRERENAVDTSIVKLISASDTRALNRLLVRDEGMDPTLVKRVAAIVADVRRGGDRALLAYARKFDALSGAIEISRDEIEDGARQAPASVRRAIRVAARNIARVAKAQVPRGNKVRVVPGVTIEQRVQPLASVGCYVPGGRYPLPSSLLMTAIPARVAGVAEIIACCPRPEPAVLAAAREAGITRLFRMGGAHAIAALAYGTASVPRVDKIVGPGNAYVASAKALVAKDCAIDFYAGPSEIVIVSTSGNPEWMAADLLAQAEHDIDARAILLTPSKRLATQVHRALAAQAPAPADGPARDALRRRGGIVLTRNLREAIALANKLAPEHLVVDDESVAKEMTTAGAVFVGAYAAQAAGDYATGSNHVLPTNGAARFRGGLSAADFVRVSSVQTLSRAGLQRLAPSIVALADAEGLRAHAASIKIRL